VSVLWLMGSTLLWGLAHVPGKARPLTGLNDWRVKGLARRLCQWPWRVERALLSASLECEWRGGGGGPGKEVETLW